MSDRTMKQLFKERLSMRAERLVKLVKLGVPTLVVAHEVILIQRAMMGFDAEAFGKALADDGARRERVASGFCVGCAGEPPPLPEPERSAQIDYAMGRVCPKCMQELIDDEDDEDGMTPPLKKERERERR